MKESTPVNAAGPSFSAATVLVVDAFVVMQNAFTKLFCHYGNSNVSCIKGVDAACIAIEILNYDIIVTSEPPHAVRKLLDFLRNKERTKDIYVLVVSSIDEYGNSIMRDPQDLHTDYLIGEEIDSDAVRAKIKEIAENWETIR